MSNDLLDLAAIRRCGIALPMTFMILAAAGAGFGARPAAAQVGETINEELLSLTGTQPALAADVRGGFVAIWTDTEAENEGLGIRGCLLEPKEGGCGPHFAVNTTAVGDQIRPSVTADDPGRFVVVWQNGYSPSALGAESTQVRGQRFGAGGVKLGPELHLSGSMPGDQEGPKVAMSEGGDFIVTWQSDQDNRVEVARFAASGKPVGQVFATETEGQSNGGATVARYPGGFAVGWTEDFERSGGRSDFAVAAVARFDASGRPVGKIERLGGDQSYGVEALLGSREGSLAIFGSFDGYSAQRFAVSGEPKDKRFPLAGEASCSSSDGPCESIAAVDMDSRGRFVVIWEVTERASSNLFAQLFTPAGKARTERIPVNASPSQAAETPAVALADEGSVVVSWTRSDTLHPEKTGLFLRRLRLQ